MRASFTLIGFSGVALAAALLAIDSTAGPILVVSLLGCCVAWLAALHDSWQRKRRHDNLLEATRRERMATGALEALALAVGTRAPVSEGRIRRMRHHARAIGQGLGLGAEDLDRLDFAVLIQGCDRLVPRDAGPAPCAVAPGDPVLEAEPATTAGIDLLRAAGVDPAITAMIAHQRAPFDGAGRPDGPMGMEIPLGSRILAVVGCLEDLTSDRARDPLPTAQALERLRDLAGSRLDPRIVDRLARIAPMSAPASSPSGAPRDGTAMQDALDRLTSASLRSWSVPEITRALGRPLDAHEVIGLTADRLGRIVRWDTCVLWLMSEDQDRLEAAEAFGTGSESILATSMPIGCGVTGRAVARRRALGAARGVPSQDAAPADPDPASAGATLALPLIDADFLIGCLTLYRTGSVPFSRAEIRVLETAARDIAPMLRQAPEAAGRGTAALIDPDSALPNARYLNIAFDRERARSRAEGIPLSLLRIEILGLDALAARQGDRAAARIAGLTARSIRSNLRVADTCARFSTGVFVALLPGLDRAEAQRIADRLRLGVRPHGGAIPLRDPVAISVGVATAGAAGASLEAMVAAAAAPVEAERVSSAVVS